ncbi:MAG: hypothetical protein HC860_02765 [Alkalinema sp. RU_4_3]|nr:hypothetical protein [Alkalinema sp. RU_4_3]
MKSMFRMMTVTVFAALLGSSAIAQAAAPVATSSQQLSAKDLLKTEPRTVGPGGSIPAPPVVPGSGIELQVPQAPAISIVRICYGRCGGPEGNLKRPQGETRQDTQTPVFNILGNVQPFVGTPMDPNAIGAKVPIFTMP